MFSKFCLLCFYLLYIYIYCKNNQWVTVVEDEVAAEDEVITEDEAVAEDVVIITAEGDMVE